MKEIIFIPNRKEPDNRIHFRVNDELWENLFHHIAFLAESGNPKISVRFCKEKNNP